MLVLEIKGLSYESKLLEFSKGDHKAPGYLSLNPRGKVPTLQDGDFILYESVAIMAYLERKYPEPAIFGKSAQETGLIWRSISETESYLTEPGMRFVLPFYFGKGLDKTDEIQATAAVIRQELQTIEAALVNSNWLVGTRTSAADIALFPLIQTLVRAAGKEAAKPFSLGFLPTGDS
jgi:glutathione S-transferase